MTYPSSTPGDPSPYGPSGYRGPPPQPDNSGQDPGKGNKGKWVAALGVAASIATILTLFITLDQQPNPAPNNNGGDTTTVSVGGYPVNVHCGSICIGKRHR